MPFWYTVNLWVHLLSAVVWVGGLFFISLVVAPLARALGPPTGPRLLQETGRRFRLVAWPSLFLLVATGLVSGWYRGWWGLVFGGRIGERPGGDDFVTKVGLTAFLILLAALHDFVLGPRVSALERQGAPRERALALRRANLWLARLLGLVALLVVLLSALVARS